jgi:hypothetical protein
MFELEAEVKEAIQAQIMGKMEEEREFIREEEAGVTVAVRRLTGRGAMGHVQGNEEDGRYERGFYGNIPSILGGIMQIFGS